MTFNPECLDEGPMHINRGLDMQIRLFASLLIDKADIIGLKPDEAEHMAVKTVLDTMGLPEDSRAEILERLEASMAQTVLEGAVA